MAIYKWNELNYEHFNEVLVAFEKGESWTVDKVLEIQEPFSIKVKHEKRTFIGRGIRVSDYPEHNKAFLEHLKVFEKLLPETDLTDSSLSMCQLFDKGPKIVPLIAKHGEGGDSLTVIRHAFFGEKNEQAASFEKIFGKQAPQLWYMREEGERIMTLDQDKLFTTLPTERFIRFRTIDLSDWKRLVDDWINGITDEITKDDLSDDDIKFDSFLTNQIVETANKYGGLSKILGN